MLKEGHLLRSIAVACSIVLVASSAKAQATAPGATSATSETSPVVVLSPALDAPRREQPRRWEFRFPVVGRLYAGTMVNYLTLHGRAAIVGASVDAAPSLERGPLRIRTPIGLRHRQAFGTPWTESYGDGSLEVRYAPVRRLHVEASFGATARLRQAWLDQYQPIRVDNLMTTHRYSRWSRFFAVELGGMPIRRHHARLAYRHEYTDYWADSNYQAYVAPTHLVPQDRLEHRLEGAWHYLRAPLRVGVDVVARSRNYYFAFARDAGSGITHATAGGTPNPLFRVWFVEPTLDARVDAGDHVRIRVAYGHEVQVDAYQGYFSFQGPHPSIGLEMKVGQRFSAELEGDVRWRTYGPNSFQAVGTHPPLEDGTRRYAHRYRAHVTASYVLGRHASLYADSTLVVRSSNRPDYVPGVFPASRLYDIDLDYTNFMATMGVRVAR